MPFSTATPAQPQPATPPVDCDTSQFFHRFFAELEQRGVPCVVLHSYRNFPEQIDSDVDYAVRDADVTRVQAILSETAAKTGWLLVQTLQYDIGCYYSVVVNPRRPGTFLKLDRCSHYTRNGCLFIRDDVLLADRKQFNGFFIPCASSEFIYTLTKVFAKRKPIAGYLPRLRELWSAEPERSEKLFHSVFGAEVGRLQDWFDRPPEAWQQLSAPMHQRNRYRLPQRMLEWRRRLRRILRPTGLRTAFLGADDTEISKVISRLEALQEPCFRRQLTLRFSPEPPPAPQLPPRNSLLSWLTVGRYYFQQWSSYLFRELPASRRSTSVIATGNFDDLLIRPAHYRLRNSTCLVRLLRRLLPQPDFTFILDAESQSLHQRRPELKIQALERQQTARHQLAASGSHFRLIPNQFSITCGDGGSGRLNVNIPQSETAFLPLLKGAGRGEGEGSVGTCAGGHLEKNLLPTPMKMDIDSDTETAVLAVWREITQFLAQRDQPRWKTPAPKPNP